MEEVVEDVEYLETYLNRASIVRVFGDHVTNTPELKLIYGCKNHISRRGRILQGHHLMRTVAEKVSDELISGGEARQMLTLVQRCQMSLPVKVHRTR